MTIKPWYYYDKPEEYRNCYKKHSEDGESPELDYGELISTIVDLYDKIAKLEARLDKQDDYQQEQQEQ